MIRSSVLLAADVPQGGTTGLDHADPGVCPNHRSVMLAPGEPCVVCHQGILNHVRTLPISPQPPLERLPPDGSTPKPGARLPGRRSPLPMQVGEEELEPPVETDYFQTIEPQGHAVMGHYA